LLKNTRDNKNMHVKISQNFKIFPNSYSFREWTNFDSFREWTNFVF
jgi:hypothetical protein